jgi:hypothetical protein
MEIESCSIILEPTFILLELIRDIHLGVTISMKDYRVRKQEGKRLDHHANLNEACERRREEAGLRKNLR